MGKDSNKTRYMRTIGKRVAIGILIVAVALVMLIPFAWMVSTAFKITPEVVKIPPTLIPDDPTLENFPLSWNSAPFGRFYINSLIVTSVITLSVMFLASLTGFALAKYKFRGREFVFFYFLGTMIVPFEVIMIPLFYLMHQINLVDTYPGIILPSMLTAFGIFLMRQFITTIPDDLLDAARIDGCGEFWIYWNIILPLTKPAMATLLIFTFMWNWDDFLWPLVIIQSTKMQTIPLGLSMFAARFEIQAALTWNLIMAATLISIIPVIAVFLFMQKYFVKGITLSGLKG